MPEGTRKPTKPPLAAICAAFSAGNKIKLGADGPLRERQQFSGAYLKRAMSAHGVPSKTKAGDVLDWMTARGLVAPAGSGFELTPKGTHVADRACTVMARRSRR